MNSCLPEEKNPWKRMVMPPADNPYLNGERREYAAGTQSPFFPVDSSVKSRSEWLLYWKDHPGLNMLRTDTLYAYLGHALDVLQGKDPVTKVSVNADLKIIKDMLADGLILDNIVRYHARQARSGFFDSRYEKDRMRYSVGYLDIQYYTANDLGDVVNTDDGFWLMRCLFQPGNDPAEKIYEKLSLLKSEGEGFLVETAPLAERYWKNDIAITIERRPCLDVRLNITRLKNEATGRSIGVHNEP